MLRSSLVLSVLLSVVLAPSVSEAQGAPGDVESVKRLWELHYQGASSDEIRAEIRSIAEASVSRVLLRSSLKNIASSEDFSRWLRRRVDRESSKRVSSDLRGPGAKKELAAYVRQVTSDDFAHELVSKWFGLPPPERGGGAKKVDSDKVGSLLSGQIRRVVHQNQGLRLDPEYSFVVQDEGGAGTGNGVLDAGEWVLLRWHLSNPTARPYFSTSAWVTAASDCLWTDSQIEYVLGEMDPNGGAPLTTWFYLSPDCPPRQPLSLKMVIRDTHRNDGAQEEIRVELQVERRNVVQLVDVFLDDDVPGFSDGVELEEIEPNRRFELSTTLATSDASAAEVTMD